MAPTITWITDEAKGTEDKKEEGQDGKIHRERQWWFKVDWDDAEEEDGIDPWVNLKDVKALRAAFVG